MLLPRQVDGPEGIRVQWDSHKRRRSKRVLSAQRHMFLQRRLLSGLVRCHVPTLLYGPDLPGSGLCSVVFTRWFVRPHLDTSLVTYPLLPRSPQNGPRRIALTKELKQEFSVAWSG